MILYWPGKPARVNPDKGKKTMKKDWQRRVLWSMFYRLEGPITPELREQAVRETGLAWNKIYKWIFDMGDLLQRHPINIERQDGDAPLDFSRTKRIFKLVKCIKKGKKHTHKRQ